MVLLSVYGNSFWMIFRRTFCDRFRHTSAQTVAKAKLSLELPTVAHKARVQGTILYKKDQESELGENSMEFHSIQEQEGMKLRRTL